jgi:hypothetical protein
VRGKEEYQMMTKLHARLHSASVGVLPIVGLIGKAEKIGRPSSLGKVGAEGGCKCQDHITGEMGITVTNETLQTEWNLQHGPSSTHSLRHFINVLVSAMVARL